MRRMLSRAVKVNSSLTKLVIFLSKLTNPGKASRRTGFGHTAWSSGVAWDTISTVVLGLLKELNCNAESCL